MFNSWEDIHYDLYLMGFVAGALVLCGFSFLQKYMAHIDPFIVKAYIIPLVLGGLVGTAFSHTFAQCKRLNQALVGRLAEMNRFLPVCSHCKRVKKTGCADSRDHAAWIRVEEYIADLTASSITHGICPECYTKLMDDIDR